MDRGALWATVHGVAKKSDTIEWLTHTQTQGNPIPEGQLLVFKHTLLYLAAQPLPGPFPMAGHSSHLNFPSPTFVGHSPDLNFLSKPLQVSSNLNKPLHSPQRISPYITLWFNTSLLFLKLFFNWSTVDIQHCVSYCCRAKWFRYTHTHTVFPRSVSGKEPTCRCRRHKTLGFNPWVGKTPWRRAPLQYSCLENSTDRGAWQAIVCGVAKSWTWLND